MSRTEGAAVNTGVCHVPKAPTAPSVASLGHNRVAHVEGIGSFPTAAQTEAANEKAKAETELVHHAKRSGKLLYAITYLHGPPVVGQRKMDSLYCHAEDAGEARLTFFRSPAAKGLVGMTIVAVGPVIGYHVRDSHGDKLSV